MGEVGYYRPDVFFVPVLIFLAAVVCGFILYTLIGRHLYERRLARLAAERLRVEEAFGRLETTGDPEAARRLVRETMRDILAPSRAHFAGLISVLDEPRRTEYSRYAAPYENEKKLSARALRSPFRWRRIEAIEAAGGTPGSWALDVLARCLEDDDEDIVYAAMSALARRREPYAAELLLRLLGTPRADPKRVLAMIDRFPIPIEDLVWSRLEDGDPNVRAGAAAVLESSGDPRTVPRLVAAAGDPDADVRSAAIRSLSGLGDARALATLPAAFEDEVWFVRASAARLAGALGAYAFYERLVGLLRDKNWWVRQNAKTALIALCPEIERGLIRYLAWDDPGERFLRNMVAEVLDASGAVERRAAELEEDPDDVEARRFFENLVVAEGRGSVEGLARRASPKLRRVLLEILEAGAARAS